MYHVLVVVSLTGIPVVLPLPYPTLERCEEVGKLYTDKMSGKYVCLPSGFFR